MRRIVLVIIALATLIIVAGVLAAPNVADLDIEIGPVERGGPRDWVVEHVAYGVVRAIPVAAVVILGFWAWRFIRGRLRRRGPWDAD